MSADLPPRASRYEQDRSWLTATSAARRAEQAELLRFLLPAGTHRENAANLYGDLPPYESTRNEASAS
jgi:hypothetical protein